MNNTNLRTRITLLLLLLQSTSSLNVLTPHVLVPTISSVRSTGHGSRDISFSSVHQAVTSNTKLPKEHVVTNYPRSPSLLYVAYPGREKVGAKSLRKAMLASIYSFARATGLVFGSLAKATKESVRKYWWCHPMLLALVPPYSLIFNGSWASMPDWWSVFDMSHLATPEKANWILASFLGSNVAYALSAIYLIKRFGFVEISERGRLKFKPTKLSMLAVWLTLSGVISTVYHSFQTMGSFALAESFCYVDHAIAGSSIFYFFHTCGNPSKRTWTIGAMSLLALFGGTPSNYAWIHSSWHYLSALTATAWALDGYQRISDSKKQDEASGDNLEMA